MNRVIRVKEWGCNKKLIKRPGEQQLIVSSNSLIDKEYLVNTDCNGFVINSKSDNQSSLSYKNIVLLGDSFVESLFVDEDKRFSAVLESLTPGYNVLNGGHSGATSLHLLNVILNKIIPLQPSYVLFFLPTNDQRVQHEGHGFWNKDPRLAPMVPLDKNACLIDEYPENALLFSTQKILQLVTFALTNYKIPHGFSTTPHCYHAMSQENMVAKTGLNIDWYGERKENNAILREFCKKYMLDFIDLESIVNQDDYFYDALHLTIESSPIVAKILYKELLAMGVFDE